MGLQRAGIVTPEEGILVAFPIVTLAFSEGRVTSSHSVSTQTPSSHHTTWKFILILGPSMWSVTPLILWTQTSRMSICTEWTGQGVWENRGRGQARSAAACPEQAKKIAPIFKECLYLYFMKSKKTPNTHITH